MPFQITALSVSDFQPLFSKSDEELASLHAVRMVADQKPGYPCRVSLADAEIGEEVILVHYEHQKTHSPFKSGHAVFVRPNATEPHLKVNQVPVMLRSRTLSLRGFDQAGMLVVADLANGTAIESSIEAMFSNASVAYIHLHFAKPGCYAARADRAAA